MSCQRSLRLSRFCCLIATMSLAWLAAPVLSEPGPLRPGEIDLRYIFREGDTTRTRLTVDTTTRTKETISEGEWEQRQMHEFTFAVRIASVTADGVGSIEMTIESLRTSFERTGERPREFDTAHPSKKGSDPALSQLSDLVGKLLVMKVDPDGAVLEMKGVDHIARALVAPMSSEPGAGGLAEGLVRSMADDSLAGALESGLRILPGKPVRKGEKWTTRFSQKLPLGTAAESVWNHRLASVDRRRVPRSREMSVSARIESDITMRLGADQAESGGGKGGGAKWIDLVPGVQIRMPGAGGKAITQFDATLGKATRSEVRMKAPIEVRVEGLEGPRDSPTLRQEVETLTVHEEIVDTPSRR